jgi:hypothetical protein
MCALYEAGFLVVPLDATLESPYALLGMFARLRKDTTPREV